MRYRVNHTTRYSYESPASQCLNETHLTPRTLVNQSVLESKITVLPSPTFYQTRKDYFGNDVTTFSVLEMHDHLIATAESVVEVHPLVREIASSVTWEEALTVLAEQPDSESLVASEFTFDSPFVSASPELAEYAMPSFALGRPLFDAVQELSHRIHDEFKYVPKSTSIEMPLDEILSKRCGVCQDFAHVMIGALRSLRLSARYVSGYLRSGASFQGAEASHAWVSVYVPGNGWLSFDPTNDVMPSEGHVTLAWGRDYGDVTPVKGVTIGGGEQIIEVAVRVSPLES
jgi:transglutaminase-like putative cysteine protease